MGFSSKRSESRRRGAQQAARIPPCAVPTPTQHTRFPLLVRVSNKSVPALLLGKVNFSSDLIYASRLWAELMGL